MPSARRYPHCGLGIPEVDRLQRGHRDTYAGGAHLMGWIFLSFLHVLGCRRRHDGDAAPRFAAPGLRGAGSGAPDPHGRLQWRSLAACFWLVMIVFVSSRAARRVE